MNIFVMSREKAVEYCARTHSIESIVISIRDMGGANETNLPRMTKDNNVKAILPLYFNDVDSGGCAITQKDAIRIKRFIERNMYGTDGYERVLIVHCGAGVSRSAGVAAAIMVYYNHDDSPIFDSPMYNPNMLCYRTVLNALFGA